MTLFFPYFLASLSLIIIIIILLLFLLLFIYNLIVSLIVIGTAAVCRSYASAASHEYERPSVFGAISAAQAIGFIVGPGK